MVPSRVGWMRPAPNLTRNVMGQTHNSWDWKACQIASFSERLYNTSERIAFLLHWAEDTWTGGGTGGGEALHSHEAIQADWQRASSCCCVHADSLSYKSNRFLVRLSLLLNLLLSLTTAAVAARQPNPLTDITFGCGPIFSEPWCTTDDPDESRTLLEYANRVGGSNSRNANCIGFNSDLNQCCKPKSFRVLYENSIFTQESQKYTKGLVWPSMIVINDHGEYFGGAQLKTGPHDGVWEATSYPLSL
ncbi:uncharacterized protein PGTG_07217 [Puccinia graminis f. sp. tritici CRL 75-36-700-3]|uniref:Uncharacterized protein n=1 Tax=Puccinia graminis f. sp. tritici (strain CRL 75-36-700-3 / race SCCL) TaxID=418459 RepID=E3K9W1_PUCGT|nr:uncharacterized protein PGTG_07217 [Puccinia graminis f. sp. tritici CRL 75-36-700-3]EFP80965.2 hypothetical protein PGTG_07217 [Puccinia graminis f. sp. tritici CRL 75-36-700-3]